MERQSPAGYVPPPHLGSGLYKRTTSGWKCWTERHDRGSIHGSTRPGCEYKTDRSWDLPHQAIFLICILQCIVLTFLPMVWRNDISSWKWAGGPRGLVHLISKTRGQPHLYLHIQLCIVPKCNFQTVPVSHRQDIIHFIIWHKIKLYIYHIK